MPSRSLARELTLLCLPVVLIGGLFGWDRWQKRFRTPTIALSVQLDKVWPPKNHVPTPIKGYGMSENERIGFGWTAKLSGGPKAGYRLGWNESIIAHTPRGPIVAWQQDTTSKIWNSNLIEGEVSTGTTKSRVATFQGNNKATHSHRYAIDQTTFPVDTQSLEWQSETVVIPIDDYGLYPRPLPRGELEGWAQMDGAATWKRTIPLPYNAQQYGPVMLQLQPPIWGSDKTLIQVRVMSRLENRRECMRVVAMQGSQQRTLWTYSPIEFGICRSISHSLGYGGAKSLFTFDIRKVPTEWGQIVFLCDTVFDTSNRASKVNLPSKAFLSEPALAAFEKKVTGYRVSRSLVLRPASAVKRGL
ncbi:hypothetical protein EON83_03020 [bacterium]|nr:MAG: hypothetical protein EON83_03020 [bacterium]